MIAAYFIKKIREKGLMKNIDIFSGIVGVIAAFFTSVFGGWTAGMTTLLIFMATDYISGIIVAGVFNKSKKSENGALESRAGFKGLCRKGMILIFVMIAYRLDLMINTNYIRDAVVIAFCTNELISIIENAGLMGIPLPAVIVKAVDVLKRKADFSEENANE
jgi:toxin secretion/phage lysis holin